MADSIKLIECPRDAWQGLKRQIPTEIKVEYLRALIDAGFKHIDAVSFVSPKAVPQMADSEKVLEQLDPPDDAEIIGIVVNEKGAERAITTERVTTLGYPYSISATFLRKNQNQSPKENYEVLEAIKKRADDAVLDTVVYISMAFGNPYGDPWSLISRVVSAVARNHEYEIGVHMHSNAADAAARVLAAYDAGCRRFDSAIGGLGGCPFAQDALVGNIPTESVIETLQQRGVDLAMRKSIESVMAMNADISSKFSS